jgi:hypothetical protein
LEVHCVDVRVGVVDTWQAKLLLGVTGLATAFEYVVLAAVSLVLLVVGHWSAEL